MLHLSFVDSDDEIESRTGVDIPFIFEKEGEEGFRKREAKVIDDLSAREGIVLATGGGAVVALDPVDRAEALFLLAVAQRDADDVAGARRSVMGALAIAPNYEEALELLLELRGTSR